MSWPLAVNAWGLWRGARWAWPLSLAIFGITFAAVALLVAAALTAPGLGGLEGAAFAAVLAPGGVVPGFAMWYLTRPGVRAWFRATRR
jgi:hypothetical protein